MKNPNPFPIEKSSDLSSLVERPEAELGHYAWKHRDYLREKHRVRYYNLLTQVKLAAYLADIEQRALQMEDRPTGELMVREGVTKQLKARDMMAWVRKRNSIVSRVREIVNAAVIYT